MTLGVALGTEGCSACTRAHESAEEHPKSDARALRRERARSVDSVPAAYLFLHLNFIIVFRRYGA